MALNGCTSLLAKAGTFAISLIVSPMAYRHLGAERFGLWMTATSFVLFTTFADLGIGNGLTMRIAEANGVDDERSAVRQISCAFYLLCGICLFSVLIAAVCFRAVNWGRFYGLNTPGVAHEAALSTLVLMLCTAANMPLGVAPRMQLGYQRGFVPDLWNGLANLLVLAASLLVIIYTNSLPLLVFVFGGIPVLTTLGNFVTEFGVRHPSLRPRIALFDMKTGLHLAAVGSLFFIQQCFGLIYYASDNIVIAKAMSATDVASYAIIQRVFSIGLITQYLVAPLWPAVGEAQSRGDYPWAARATRRAIIGGSLFSAAVATTLLMTSRQLIRAWFKVDPGPIDSLRVGFAFWVVIAGYIATMNALLNQPALMRRHLMLFGAASITSLMLKIAFARHDMLSGVAWGTVIAFGIIYVVPTARLAIRSFPQKGVGLP
ncbi:MAG: lipopolysaccharide biosynthesis protein [Edaphobacter sp.]|uniref:lipopolysaccharide biosynthesis protein n=1 Tax=Edaphobacter sp. TaxID=1934404 RepID=UPI002394F347|nr:lipopolysaccharide biosynthesis protein [Edaphobacter sp.]MDE1175008.1 lipopolysaccharide biosynthesis protein [Edaphobacter sp.]